MSKNIKILLFLIIPGFLIWFILHTFFLTLAGLSDNINQADVAVIFGNEVTSNGEPSDRLKARLDKGVQIFHDGQTKHLIVSGGFGKEGFDEATVMAKYLVNHNIPQENIFVDHNGNTTEATAKNAAKIMSENNWHSIIIISQYFHIARAKLAFQKNKINEIYSASANYFELRDLYSISREFFAYYAYLIK